MRSIFLRIFLGFWLTVATSAGVLHLAGRWIDALEQRPPLPQVMPRLLTPACRELVAAYEFGGRDALAAATRRFENETFTRAHMMAADGTVLSSASLPERGGELLGSAIRGDAPPPVPGADGMMIAIPVNTATARYALLLEMPFPPVGRWVASPTTRAGVLGAIVLTAGLLCYALARSLTSPVRRLRDAARRLAAGDLAARVGPAPAARRDELGDLARDFNHMAERIGALVEAQRSLLWDVSHELRSPLARLNVALGLVRQQTAGQADAAQAQAERDAARLEQHIQRSLALARLESGVDPGPPERVNLSELTAVVADDVAFEARARGGRIEFHCAAMVEISGWPALLRSAIENVLRNAVQHGSSRDVIEVRLETLASDARITVRDHGDGVPEGQRVEMFQPFRRLPGAARCEGAGLGLALAQRAVRLHRGTIHADNHPEGGLAVSIVLPRGDAPLKT